MTPGHRLWNKSILTGDALCAAWWPCSPFTCNNSISLELNLCILTWTTPHGLNVISATPHSTYNVVLGSHWPLSGTSASSALFSAAENFRSTCRPMSLDYPSPCPPSLIIVASLQTPSENTCSRFTSVSLVLKMAQKRLCPDNGNTAKKPKKQPGSSAKKTPTTAKSSGTGHYGDSAHKNKKIGLFTVEAMTKCIEEVKAVEARQKKNWVSLNQKNHEIKFARNTASIHQPSPSE